MKAGSSGNFRKCINLVSCILGKISGGKLPVFLTQRMRTYSCLISKEHLHDMKNQVTVLSCRCIGLLTFIKTISFLKEFSPVLTFSLFACRRVLMKRVFDTWLLNACKQQEYRMGEERVNVTLLPGLA